MRSGWAAPFGAAAMLAAAQAAAPKRDFRGLEPGMTVAQAEAAAGRNGMTCSTGFAGLTTCRGGDATVVLETTGRRGNHVFQLQVSLAGHYDAAAMKARLTAFYGLTPSPATPDVYDTAAGQQLMLLEIGTSSTVFYLTSESVLHDDGAALPPPKL